MGKSGAYIRGDENNVNGVAVKWNSGCSEAVAGSPLAKGIIQAFSSKHLEGTIAPATNCFA